MPTAKELKELEKEVAKAGRPKSTIVPIRRKTGRIRERTQFLVVTERELRERLDRMAKAKNVYRSRLITNILEAALKAEGF